MGGLLEDSADERFADCFIIGSSLSIIVLWINDSILVLSVGRPVVGRFVTRCRSPFPQEPKQTVHRVFNCRSDQKEQFAKPWKINYCSDFICIGNFPGSFDRS